MESTTHADAPVAKSGETPRVRISGRAIRETLGFLGVIGSLLFVGLEIRQNTRVARAEAYRGIEEILVQWTLASAADPELASLLRRVTFEGVRRDELTDTEKWQAGAMFDIPIRNLESIYRQVQEGVLPDDALNAFGQANNLFAAPYAREVWPVIRPNYRADFAEYFDRRLGISP